MPGPKKLSKQQKRDQRHFFKAVRMDRIDIIANLLRKEPALLNAQDEKGRSALHHSIQAKARNSFDYLQRQGDCKLALRDKRGRTPLLLCASSKNDKTKFFRKLLEIQKQRLINQPSSKLKEANYYHSDEDLVDAQTKRLKKMRRTLSLSSGLFSCLIMLCPASTAIVYSNIPIFSMYIGTVGALVAAWPFLGAALLLGFAYAYYSMTQRKSGKAAQRRVQADIAYTRLANYESQLKHCTREQFDELYHRYQAERRSSYKVLFGEQNANKLLAEVNSDRSALFDTVMRPKHHRSDYSWASKGEKLKSGFLWLASCLCINSGMLSLGYGITMLVAAKHISLMLALLTPPGTWIALGIAAAATVVVSALLLKYVYEKCVSKFGQTRRKAFEAQRDFYLASESKASEIDAIRLQHQEQAVAELADKVRVEARKPRPDVATRHRRSQSVDSPMQPRNLVKISVFGESQRPRAESSESQLSDHIIDPLTDDDVEMTDQVPLLGTSN